MAGRGKLMNKAELPEGLSPEAFIQLARNRGQGRTRVLRQHTALISQLLDAGYGPALVWRYLNEVRKVPVSRTAVWKFCRTLQIALNEQEESLSTKDAPAEMPAVIDGHGRHPLRSNFSGAAASNDRSDGGTRQVDDQHPSGRGVPAVVPPPEPESTRVAEMARRPLANEASKPAAFAQIASSPEPTIEPGREAQRGEPGNIIKRFSASTPEVKQRLREYRRSRKAQGKGNSSQGAKRDENDEHQ